MKNTFKIILSLFIITGLMMTSCVKDDFDQPETPDPCDISSGLTPTSGLTVQRLLTEYPSFKVLDAAGEVREFPVDSNYIFEGVIVSSDETGNFYKAIYVQDATGGIMLSIDGTSLFNDYKIGQTVHIKLSGLTCHYSTGSFETEIIEIGYGQYSDSYGQKIGRIPVTVLPQFVKNNSCPTTVTPIDIDMLSSDNSNIGRLVRLSDVEFIDSELDSTYAFTNKNTDRHIQDCNGNQIIVRNSGYANFAALQLPQGKGTITGIYTKYNGAVQFIIRDTTDVDMNGTRCGGGINPGAGTGSGTFDDPYDIEAATANQDAATGVWVTGYLVGVYNTDGTDNISEFTPPFTIAYNVYLAPTADETDTTKMLMIQLPSGEIRDSTNLSSNGGMYQQEVKYHGDLLTYNNLPGLKNTDGYWKMSTNTGLDPNYVDPGTIWSEDFSAIANPYDPITSMTVVMEAGTKDWHGDGYNGQSAEMSAYDSGEASNIGWLITPAIDLTTATAPKLTFYSALKYSAGDLLTVWISTNYDGGTSPQTATWTELTSANIVDSSDPVDGASGYNYTTSGDVDLSTYTSSSTVYIAWKYVGSGTNGETTKYRVDDIRIGE